MARLALRPVYVNALNTIPAPPRITDPAKLTQSLAASFNTVFTVVMREDSVAYQVNVTTTDSVGQFFMQMSADQNNWIDIGACGTVNAANDTILVEIDISRTAPYIRLRYASSTAGTGTCSILVTAKQIGGS